MTLFLLALFLGVLFVSLVHYILRPLVNELYEKYEPLWFHYDYKLRKKKEKTLRKVKEKSWKSYCKIRGFLSRF
jgi:hypothetical protein